MLQSCIGVLVYNKQILFEKVNMHFYYLVELLNPTDKKIGLIIFRGKTVVGYEKLDKLDNILLWDELNSL